MSDTTSYRITTRRPIDGRMREVGEIVALTTRQAEAELPWGGLSPVTADPLTAEPAAAIVPSKTGRKGG